MENEENEELFFIWFCYAIPVLLLVVWLIVVFFTLISADQFVNKTSIEWEGIKQRQLLYDYFFWGIVGSVVVGNIFYFRIISKTKDSFVAVSADATRKDSEIKKTQFQSKPMEEDMEVSYMNSDESNNTFKAPIIRKEDHPLHIVKSSLEELSELVQSDNYNALSIWIQKNAWIRKSKFTSDALTTLVEATRRAQEFTNMDLEGQVKRAQLDADLQEARLRAKRATKTMQALDKEPKNKQTKERPEPIDEETFLRESFTANLKRGETEDSLKKEAVSNKKDQDLVDRAMEDAKYTLEIKKEKGTRFKP